MSDRPSPKETDAQYIETAVDGGTPRNGSIPLEKIHTNETLESIDIENRHAFKGDDSDGKVAWTWRKLLACAFLSLLYTGLFHLP